MSLLSPLQPSAEIFGFAAERLLLPFDLEKCPLEALELANRLGVCALDCDDGITHFTRISLTTSEVNRLMRV